MFRTRAGRFAALLAAGACTAVLAGCDSNPEPAPLPTESASASTPTETSSPSPSVTPPTMPAAAKGTSEKSAKAFVRYWIEALNYAGPSGETEELAQLSDRACDACTAIIDLIEEVHAEGGTIRGEGWTVRSIETVSFSEKTGRVLDALVKVHPQTIRPSAGAEPSTFDGGRRLKTFWVDRGNDGWTITRLDQPQ